MAKCVELKRQGLTAVERKHTKHLNPLSEYLFQRPKTKKTLFICSQFSRRLYDNMVVRERSLGDKLKKISKDTKLSKTYTNHSIRATAVSIVDRPIFLS